MAEEQTGRMELRQPERFSRSRRPHIAWFMSLDEADDIGQAICDHFGVDDLAWSDGARLMELADEGRRQAEGVDE